MTGVRARFLAALSAHLLAPWWAQWLASASSVPPLLVVPGLGMSALHVDVAGEASFNFLVPAMNPPAVLPPPAASALEYALLSGLPLSSVDSVPAWLALDVAADGSVRSQPRVNVTPVSIARNFSWECPRYVPTAELLVARGWALDRDLLCMPYDYRLPPGEGTFARDFRESVERATRAAGGQRAVVACHSQGCLVAYHALRTSAPAWVAQHVVLLFGLAGQWSGCSDCLRWAFSPGWSWDPSASESPVDPSWAGELALGLQRSVYGERVLYRNGADALYRASDASRLLRNAGALAMENATRRYALEAQPWWRAGDGARLPIAGLATTQVVYGSALRTVLGYVFEPAVPPRSPACTQPSCGGFYAAAALPLFGDGDGGDSALMNAAPSRWVGACHMRALPRVTHMGILVDVQALDLLERSARATAAGQVPPCVRAHRGAATGGASSVVSAWASAALCVAATAVAAQAR